MQLIVGLGNPGPEYAETWHNIGFGLVDRLFERSGTRRFRSESQASVAEVSLRGISVLLVKPVTFMNASGDAVRPLLDKYGEGKASNLIVACDDVALPFGSVRVRPRGSDGGQKGLRSIVNRIGGQEFCRVRMGIGPDHPLGDLADFVLSPVPRRLKVEVGEMIDKAADAVEVVLLEGVEKAMQMFNRRIKPEPDESEDRTSS